MHRTDTSTARISHTPDATFVASGVIQTRRSSAESSGYLSVYSVCKNVYREAGKNSGRSAGTGVYGAYTSNYVM